MADGVAVTLVPIERLSDIWPLVKDLLGRAVERSFGAVTIQSLARDLTEGQAQLWVSVDLSLTPPEVLAVAVTDVGLDPSGRKTCDIRIVTGTSRKKWLHCRTEIEAWARAEGCAHIRITARKGYARELPDYRLSHVVLEKDLTHVERQETDADDESEDQVASEHADDSDPVQAGGLTSQYGPH